MCEVIGVLIDSMRESFHNVSVFLTYITILFVNDSSINLKNTANGRAMLSRAYKNWPHSFPLCPLFHVLCYVPRQP